MENSLLVAELSITPPPPPEVRQVRKACGNVVSLVSCFQDLCSSEVRSHNEAAQKKRGNKFSKLKAQTGLQQESLQLGITDRAQGARMHFILQKAGIQQGGTGGLPG